MTGGVGVGWGGEDGGKEWGRGRVGGWGRGGICEHRMPREKDRKAVTCHQVRERIKRTCLRR